MLAIVFSALNKALTKRFIMFLRSLFVLLFVISLPGYSAVTPNSSEITDVVWSDLEVEPGQIVSVQFVGLTTKPEDLRFWINGKSFKVAFEVVETAGKVDTLSDDLVVAFQYIPILIPGEYGIGIGNLEGSFIEPQALTVIPVEPKYEKKQVAETLATGFRLIARDIAGASRKGKAGFGYYSEKALRPATISSFNDELKVMIEDMPSLIRKDYGVLPRRQETQIQAMLVNMDILPALEQILNGKQPETIPWIDPKEKYLMYIDINTSALYAFGERFKLLELAISYSAERDQRALRDMLGGLEPLWVLLKNTKIDLLEYSRKYPEEDDGDDPRDTPPPTIYGEEIDAEDMCRVKVQCHWGLASGAVSAWLSKKIIGQRHCAIFTRIDTAQPVRMGHHIQGNGFTGHIETSQFQSDAGYKEIYPDYWDHWDSFSNPVNSCPIAECLRAKTSQYDTTFRDRPYKGMADGNSATRAVHPNSTSYIGAMVDSCSVPSPTPRIGVMHYNPLFRWDFKQGFTGWHYWKRAEPPVEYWQTVSSAKRRTGFSYTKLGYWLWWNS